MPKEGISVYFSVKDGASQVLKTIGDKTRALDKDTQKLAQTTATFHKAQAPLLKDQVELEKQLAKVNKEVKAAEKAYRKLGDAANDEALTKAKTQQQQLKQALAETKDMIQANERAYKNNLETIRKGETGLLGGKGAGNIALGLAASGVGGQLAEAVGGYARALVVSSQGLPQAELASGILGGIFSGASAGAVMGPYGALAGAAVGGLSGLISGRTKIFEAQDDAFKAYYNGLYEDVSAATDDRITTGSSTAAGRETDLLGFTTLLGGRRQAKDFLGSLVEKANHTPFLYDDLTAMSKTLAAYGFKDDPQAGELDILDSLITIGDAGAALGHSTADMTAVATALGRMLSSNKANLEYLNILNDRGINAVGYLAQARKMSVGATYEAISKGQIAGGDAVDIILAAMGRAYGGAMKDQSETFAGLTSTLEGLLGEISNASGEGYNQVRKGGIQAEIDAYDGPLGKELKAVNTLAGENRAALENLREEYTREALGAVLLGEKTTLFRGDEAQQLQGMAQEYRMAAAEYDLYGTRDSAMTMEQLKETAEAMATAAFESSEQYQMLQDKEVDQIAAIRDNIAATESLTAAFNSYRIQQEQSKGRGVGFFNLLGTANAAIVDDSEYDPNTLAGASSRAMGQGTVPYDGFPALLHQGERVLTASEARAQDRGDIPPISIQIHELSVREEADVDRVAEALFDRLQLARMAG